MESVNAHHRRSESPIHSFEERSDYESRRYCESQLITTISWHSVRPTRKAWYVNRGVRTGTEIEDGSPASRLKFNYEMPSQKPQDTRPLCWISWDREKKTHSHLYREEVQLRLVKCLADMLPAVKSFRSNDFDFMTSDKESSKKSNIVEKLVTNPIDNFDIDVKKMSSSKLYELFTENKEQSIVMQHFIEDANEGDVAKISELAVPLIPKLIFHKFGNYCLQKLIVNNKHFREEFESYCLERIESLVFNEYSSRTLQTLIESGELFRRYFLAFCATNTKTITKSISYVFLVTSAINCSKSEEELLPLINDLFYHPQRWFSKKYLKRVLVSLIHKSEISFLRRIELLFRQQGSFVSHFEDRYKVYIVLALLKREYAPCIQALKHSLAYQIDELIQTNFFKLFVDLLFRSRKWDMLSMIFQGVSNSQIFKRGLDQLNNDTCKVAYFLAISSRPEQFSQLVHIWKNLNLI